MSSFALFCLSIGSNEKNPKIVALTTELCGVCPIDFSATASMTYNIMTALCKDCIYLTQEVLVF